MREWCARYETLAGTVDVCMDHGVPDDDGGPSRMVLLLDGVETTQDEIARRLSEVRP